MIKDAFESVIKSRVAAGRKVEGVAALVAASLSQMNKRLEKIELVSSVDRRIMKGDIGPKGDKGDRGEKGDKGDQGARGLDGKDGINGRDGVNGRDGKDGIDGRNGVDGRNGKDGKEGKDGKDGVSVVDAELAADDHLVFQLSNGNIIDIGELPTVAGVHAILESSGPYVANALNSATTAVDVASATAPTAGQALVATSATSATWQTIAGTGDVVGPASSTNNSLARFDGVTGKLLKDGAVIGTDVQAYNARLADVAGLTPTDNGVIIGNGSNFVVESGATLKTSLGLTIGTDVQAYDADTAKLDVAQSWTAEQTFKETKDTVHTITDGAAFEIDPANGNIQVVTLGASRTPAATNFAAGQCVLLGIDDGTAYTITWTTVNPTWVKPGGTASAPTLATTGYTWILLWKVSTTIYAAEVGKP